MNPNTGRVPAAWNRARLFCKDIYQWFSNFCRCDAFGKVC